MWNLTPQVQEAVMLALIALNETSLVSVLGQYAEWQPAFSYRSLLSLQVRTNLIPCGGVQTLPASSFHTKQCVVNVSPDSPQGSPVYFVDVPPRLLAYTRF